MAKQSGIHQLRGKIGEHSYYSQTGVGSGLVRKINQGMSQKVKTDAAFVNTRLNNAEFGQAGKLASTIALYITPKYRPMVLPFSQSKMAKVLLEYLKTDTEAEWGQRNLTVANSAEAQAVALNAVAKNNFDDWALDIRISEPNIMAVDMTAQTLSKMASVGASRVTVIFKSASTWVGTFMDNQGKYADSYARANRYQQSFSNEDVEGTTLDFEYVLRPAPDQGWPAFQSRPLGILVLLPEREVNGEYYVMQEHCTYYAFPLVNTDPQP